MGEDLAVVILAGGASSRLGAFKPTVPLRGRPLIGYALGIARRSSRKVYILANSVEQGVSIERAVDLMGAQMIFDKKEAGAFPNPLVWSMRQLSHDLLFLMGCDMPFLDPLLPSLLLKRMGTHGVAIPSWPNGFVEPLTALYRRSCLPRSSVSSLRGLVEAMKPALVPVSELGLDRESFLNINTRRDLQLAERVAQVRSIST